uniref:Uncharacterized protein n=1 Tax=viral metagenome TaxID=1070528 RepID=A0A6H1ZC66_9ZZZZ
MKTWQAVTIDLAVILAATFLCYSKLISGDAVLVVLGAFGGAIGARRTAAKNGTAIPPGVVMGLITGFPSNAEDR